MIQAAGRCNREGKLTDSSGRLCPGDFYVFVSPDNPPPGVLSQAKQVTKTMLAIEPHDIFDPDKFNHFFSQALERSTAAPSWMTSEHCNSIPSPPSFA